VLRGKKLQKTEEREGGREREVHYEELRDVQCSPTVVRFVRPGG
jgi:hypothetical protein